MPLFQKKKKHALNKSPERLITTILPNSVISEQFRTIRTNIQFSMIDEKLQTLVITSAHPNAGKSTVAGNLATTFAAQGTNVLLVDTDLRRPSVHKLFHFANKEGITNLITTPSMTVDDVILATDSPKLSVLTAGTVPPNPTELLGSDRMKAIVEELKQRFDLIIFDTPPILGFTDAQIMAGNVDGTVFVIETGVTKKNDIVEASELLNLVQANILGAIHNRVPKGANRSGYYYYGYGYNYGQDS